MFKSAPKGNWTGTKPQGSGKPREDNNKRKLFVAGIGSEAREEDVRNMFRDYAVDSVFLKCEGETKAHCFVTFETEAVMQEVLRNAAKFWLNGRLVTIRNVIARPDNGPGAGRSPGANPSGDGADGTTTTPLHAGRDQRQGGDDKSKELFVGGLPNEITEEDIHRLFEQFGIEKVVLKKPDNSAKRPFAFVTLREVAAVAAATTQMNGHLFLGRRINVATANRGGGAPSSRATSPPSAPWGQAPSSSSERASVEADSREGALAERRPSDVAMAPPTLENMPDDDHPADQGCLSNGPPGLEVCAEDPLETSSNSSEPVTPSLQPGAGEEWHEIYVGNLRHGTTQADLEAMLQKYGVASVSMKNKGSSVYAFVELTSEDGVQAAIRDLHGALNADGKPMAIRKSNPSAKIKSFAAKAPSKTPPSTGPATVNQNSSTFLNKNKVYLANLPIGTTKHDVEELFSKYNTKDVLLVTKGIHPYAFVTLGSTAAFESALQELQGVDYKGSKLYVGLPHKEWMPSKDHASHKPSKGAPSKEQQATLLVFNFPFKTSRNDVLELLSCWEPLEVRMGEVQRSPEAYTHAHVTLGSLEAAEDAVLSLDQTPFRGRLLGAAILRKGAKPSDQH